MPGRSGTRAVGRRCARPGRDGDPRSRNGCGAVESVAHVGRERRLVADRKANPQKPGAVDFADQVFPDDYVRHDLRPTEAAPGPEGQKQIAAAFRSAFPDLRFTVELVFGEGDLIE
ncbi:ester cyclase [Actinocrispum sp. NPDC049592]|uniref:ester cyclase n=1 Tax=Actinocrispum sp. NPDC049592 TaxID=3154835 RepID=UPI0034359009